MALALLGAVTDNEHDGLYATSRWGILTRGIQPASFSYSAYPLLPRRLDQGCTGSMVSMDHRLSSEPRAQEQRSGNDVP